MVDQKDMVNTKYCSGDQINKKFMGEACDTYGDRGGAYRVFVVKVRERDHFENLGVDGRIILKWSFRKYNGCMD
jgi:hypothetical protein